MKCLLLVILMAALRCEGRSHPNPRFCTDEAPYKDCKFWRDMGYCKTHQKSLHILCPVSCGLCDWEVRSKPKCVDEDGYFNCKFMKENGVCYTHSDLMSRRCAKTCNLCDAGEKCSKISCPSRQVCTLDKNGDATCQCPHYCPYKNTYKRLGKVCGDDGKTYKDYCHLLHHACREDRQIVVANYGECVKEKPCEDSQRESESGMCESWKDLGLCNAHKEVMKRHCQKTCEFCPDRFEYPLDSCHTSTYGCCWDGKTARGPKNEGCSPCADKYPDLCLAFMNDCNSVLRKNEKFMKSSCPATCGFCMPTERREVEIRIYSESGERLFQTHFKSKAGT